jgi:hypothetical protein
LHAGDGARPAARGDGGYYGSAGPDVR